MHQCLALSLFGKALVFLIMLLLYAEGSDSLLVSSESAFSCGARMSLQAVPTRRLPMGPELWNKGSLSQLPLGIVSCVTLIHGNASDYNAGFLLTFPFHSSETLPVLVLQWAVTQKLSLMSQT